MKGNGITTVKFKTISIALVMSIILQIVIPILMPLKSIAGTKIEESVTTEKLGDIKLSTTPDNSTISIGDEIIIDVIVTGTDIVGFAGYINYDNNVFNEIDTSNIITSYRIDDDAGPEDDGYYLSVRDGSNIGASNSTMFSIKFVAKANADISTVSIIGIWLTQAGKPAVPDYGPDDMGYDVSITFPEQVETYSVKYNKNTTDEVTEMPTNATNITKGTSYTIGQEPKREGYAFTGWQTADGTAYIAGNSYEINSNLDLYAQWRELNKYTITYNKNTTDEVTNMPTSSETKTEGIDYTIAAAPTRTGHTFEGWNTKSDGTGTSYVAESLYRTDENLELFAKWTPIRTTLTVNPNGGVWETFSTAQDYVGEYNTTKQISNPTSGPKGYLINFDPNGGETEDLIKEQTTTFDRWTLTGGGTLNGNTFTYGTESGTLTATYVGNNIILPLATKQGHRFKGWYTAPTEGTLIGQVGDTYMPDGSKRLYAQWEEIEYNVTINPAGGTYKGTTEVSTETGNFEETIVLEIPKAPKGYTITLNNDDTITTVEQKNTFNKWIKSGKGIIEENIYTFGDGDGTLTATYTPKEVELETPIKNGYRFDGWYTLKIGGTKVESGFIPEEDMILYAHWTAEKYTVTFNPGENATVNPTSKEVTYGEEYGELPVPTKTGGTFLGWYNGNEEITADNIVEITSNITLTAKWEETTYTLTVNLNGGKVGENTTIAPITGKYNETVTLPTVTAPEGYTITLNNNYGSNETKTQKQTQRLEKWTTQDGGEITGLTYTFGEKDDTITAVYKREAVTLEEPGTRTGYTFEGWYTEAENGVKVNNEYEPTGDIELFAHWTAKKYTVTFNPGENATVNPTSKEVTYGEEYGELPVPTKAGGKFLGWYNGETQITQNTIVEITSNITLIARWEGEVYTLTVNLNGGKVGENTTIAPITGTYNETITLPTVTAPEGYTITLNNNYGENQTKTQKQTQRLEKWTTQDGGEITGLTYTFGEKDDTITAVYVREPVTLETITRTGYKFEGWYTEAENGVKVNNEYEPTGDIELFAHWTAEKYTVTFNPGNNATVDTTSKEVTYEEKYGELPIPQRPGYEFNGWYNGNEEITADDIVEITNDTTLTAKWLGAEYTVTFDYGDGEGTQTTKTVRNEGTYGQLPEATKEGHEFEGWFDDNGNKIESTTIVNLTQDITLHARYTPKQYTIKFLNDDGSIIEQKTVNHGDTITYTGETPEKGNVPLGYNAVFSGWDNE
ncbi:MAG: InlB B-repeat-containing protein, partial [Clostridia bacterium]|nr:InlB B-repeat-containing protein [Clostridia bacterium]